MLLRRVIEHVKTQNWTAVAIDFLIVVVGVFVGLQVTNWNDARRERQLEQVYLQRLHDEAKSGVDGFFGFVERALAPKFEAYQATVELLSDAEGEGALSVAHCDAIGNMHDFIAMPFQFPSLAEMAASGRLGLIRDAGLRQALTQYRLMHDQNEAFGWPLHLLQLGSRRRYQHLQNEHGRTRLRASAP